MSGRKLSDTATTADWSFLDNADLMVSINQLVAGSARRLPLLDEDDLRQETCLWLSVRPGLMLKPLSLIEKSIYGRLRDIEKAERKRADPLLPLLEGDLDE